jgi:TRAP transporter 4TM/12TM fusion protein
MRNAATLLGRIYLGAIVVIGFAWIIDVPQFFGVSLISAEWIGLLLAAGVAAAFIRYPYGEAPGLLEIVLGAVGIGCWIWMSLHYNAWVIDISGYTASKFVPGILAVVLLMEAMRKSAGWPITILVWVLIVYGFFGYLLPQPFQAERLSAPSLIMYVYSDTNGIPGLVMTVVGNLVLAFVLLGKLMEVSGATQFFTDLALGSMGHRRGGPAKVAVVASSVFGSINGTAIGNIMSTGIVTIPLMKRSGFKPQFAAAIEAVASNGGQIAPPVMGATAFLIAEFLQVSYIEVVAAAVVPAILYYLCLFLQVDAIAARDGLHGLPKRDLPAVRAVMKRGWSFLLPLAVLVYLLFWRGFDPALSAIAAMAALFGLMMLRKRRLMTRSEWSDLVIGGAENMLPLLMIAGGAGVVIGVMNITGLGFSLSIVLNQIGTNAGSLAMLALTAVISIVLGMGMPTAAIYVVLSVVLAPALVQMGVAPMAAHLFIFYFGLLSFLTPPVAIASFVAAGLAGSNMWTTAWEGMKLAAVAYLLPFLWCYNQALLLQGSPRAIALVILTSLIAVLLVARATQVGRLRNRRGFVLGVVYLCAAVAVGGSTVWQRVPAQLDRRAAWNFAVGTRAAAAECRRLDTSAGRRRRQRVSICRLRQKRGIEGKRVLHEDRFHRHWQDGRGDRGQSARGGPRAHRLQPDPRKGCCFGAGRSHARRERCGRLSRERGGDDDARGRRGAGAGVARSRRHSRIAAGGRDPHADGHSRRGLDTAPDPGARRRRASARRGSRARTSRGGSRGADRGRHGWTGRGDAALRAAVPSSGPTHVFCRRSAGGGYRREASQQLRSRLRNRSDG